MSFIKICNEIDSTCSHLRDCIKSNLEAASSLHCIIPIRFSHHHTALLYTSPLEGQLRKCYWLDAKESGLDDHTLKILGDVFDNSSHAWIENYPDLKIDAQCHLDSWLCMVVKSLIIVGELPEFDSKKLLRQSQNDSAYLNNLETKRFIQEMQKVKVESTPTTPSGGSVVLDDSADINSNRQATSSTASISL